MQKVGRYVILVLALLVSFGLGGWFAGYSAGKKEMMIQAVKENHGHYKIVDNVGSTVFEWGAAAAAPAPAQAPVPPPQK